MSNVSLYEVSVGSYLQILPALTKVLDIAARHCEEKDINPDSLLEERLIDDMWPLAQQLNSVKHHSQGAIEGVERGLFQPPPALPDMSFAEYQQLIADATAYLQALDADAVNVLGGKDMQFKAGDFELPFTGKDFLVSFSLPNFYFHVTISYGLLRKAGVSIGKLDYIGQLKIKA